jgi:DNA-directed RNA polymerase specialized sigma24 family protein
MENPRNVLELYCDHTWRAKIELAVSRFHLKEDVQDTVADIFLLMLSRVDPSGQGLDYIERWDPTSASPGSFANWVYTFVRNFCLKKLARSKSKGGRLIEGADALVPQERDREFPERGTVFEDTVGGDCREISTAEIFATCEQIAARLAREAPANSWVEYTADGYFVRDVTGRETFHPDRLAPDKNESQEEYANRLRVRAALTGHAFRRDAATVLRGLIRGEFESGDLAEIFKTSRQFIYTLLEKIREDPQAVELANALD